MARILGYIATSLDGFIAAPDDGLDWLLKYDTADFGGGISVSYAAATLTNSTISGNSGGGIGGGSYPILRITNSTITRNSGGGVVNGYLGDLTLERTLISGNTGRPGAAEVDNDPELEGRVQAANFNLFGHSGLTNAQAIDGFTPGPTDITATSNGNDPTALPNILNTTLANNGGPTRTHALVAGSPAIDTVTDGTCPPPNQDQRGVRRPKDGNGDGAEICDTGSFERRPRE
jgi:hypothetical protein